MQCHVCGTEVRQEHKFCVECGARLHRSTGQLALDPPHDDAETSRLPLLAAPTNHPMFDPATGQLLVVPPPPPLPPPDDDATNVLPALGEPVNTATAAAFGPPDVSMQGPGHWEQPADTGPIWPGEEYGATVPNPVVHQPRSAAPAPGYYEATSRIPATYTAWEPEPWGHGASVERPAFRVKPLLLITILALAAAVTAMVVPLLDVDAAAGGVITTVAGEWRLNDFGTNLTVTGILVVVAMVLGGVAWCAGYRWGAGVAGGAGAGLAGWAALVLGAAEVPISIASGSAVSRGIGYWGVAAAGGLGLVTLFVSMARAGDDRRAGLDPWVAALGAMATIAAVIGPLIPINGANLDLNWSSAPGTDLPTLFFVGRFVQLGLLLLSGVFGFLLVRRYGLGLVIGGTIGAGWLVLTTASEQTDAPIGLAAVNPGSTDGKPHIVTMVGVGLILFFGLVATAMALIDDR